MGARRSERSRAMAWAVAAVIGAHTSAVPGADSWTIELGVRETGDAGPIGSNGSVSGPIEWITSTSPTLTTADGWKQFTWDFGNDPVAAFTGDSLLNAPGNKGVLEHIRIVNSGGNVAGELRLRIDDIVNTVNGTPTLITDFDSFPTNIANDTLLFREPITSPSTIAHMSTGPNGTLISTSTAVSGTRSLAARWTFVPNGDTSQWLRLTTNNAAILPDPVIDLGPNSTLSMWLNMQVYQPTGNRVRGIDVSSNQGAFIDWNRVAQPMSAGGAGLSFAFVRATRGGTSGTSTTGAMRVDDTQYAYNIAGAKAAGMLTGPYHFGRPDRWTPNDAVGLGNAPGSIGTPEDEARHYLQVAGSVMKPGYLRPVYDLEDGNEETNPTQLTNFVLRFNETITKYKGPSAKLIVYSGTSYANSVNEDLSQFPLWMPRFQVESDWDNGDVFPNESSYGVWGDGDPNNPLPWDFWQYYSPDLYIPGVNAGTHNDIDVAHGDINYVRQFLVQGAIWTGSANAAWTQDLNWDTGLSPSGSTEVLFDLGIPATGATITLTSGRSAGGIYFADSYTLSGGNLTLTDGRIDVDGGKTSTIATSLSTPNGFRKVGTGTMTHASGTSTVTGVAQVLQGTMNVSGGSIAVSGSLLVNPELTQFDKSLIAPLPTTPAQITSAGLTISGGTMTAPAAYVGGTETESGAIGTLTVSSGSLTVAGLLKVWDSTLPHVDSRVNLVAGYLSVGSLDTDGNPAGFNWTGGTLAVTGAGGLSISGSGPLGATVTVGMARTLVVNNTLSLVAAGGVAPRLNLHDGGVVTVGSLDTGGDPSRLNWTGGMLTLLGPGATDLGPRTLGGASSQTLNVWGGTVNTGELIVGNTGTATVDQTAGMLQVGATSSNLLLAAQPGSTGTYNVGGTGGLVVTGTAYVGGSDSAAGGTGVLNLTSPNAHFFAPVLKIWDSGAAAPAGTRVNLSNGAMYVGHIDSDGNPARFNFTGGTLNHAGPGTSDLSGTTVGALATMNISGGTITGTSLTIDPDGLVHVDPPATLSAPTTNNGFLSVNGGTVTSSVHNNGILQVAQSEPSVFGPAATVDNAGTININSPANVAFNAGVAGPGTINVAAGASATTVVVASGTLNVDGTLAVLPDWPVTNIAGSLSVTGKLDLNNNKLVVFAGTPGTWNGSAYTGVTGLVESGRAGGAWDGNGIITSDTRAHGDDDFATLGVAMADDLGRIGDVFGGYTLAAGDVMVMFTYGGDANLDGKINIDDYGRIDSHIGIAGANGWADGDFNYDGKINIDDYGIIDSNISQQGAGGGGGIAAIPEPAGLIAILSSPLLLLRRRRLAGPRS